MAKCAICDRTFGMTLRKHTCVLCRRTVCGGCSSSSVPVTAAAVDAAAAAAGEKTKPDGKDSDSDGDSREDKKKVVGKSSGSPTNRHAVVEARVCSVCQASGKTAAGRRLGGEAPASATAVAPGGGTEKPDASSAAEREKRALLIEARMNRQKGPGAAATRTAPPPAQPSAPRAAPVATPAVAPVPVAAASSQPASNGGGNANPALEAALRRQQQRRSEATVGAERNYSEEKRRLLREIEAIHCKTGTDAPFGLKAADESHLRSYLQHLRSTTPA